MDFFILLYFNFTRNISSSKGVNFLLHDYVDDMKLEFRVHVLSVDVLVSCMYTTIRPIQ